jgi:hypothetical protein
MNQPIVVLTPEQLEEVVDRVFVKRIGQMPQGGAKEVFTLQEAADFLGRHPKVVTRMVREEGLPAHYISEREPRFMRAELIAWLGTRPTRAAEET